jgi:hypothetical protein
MWCKGLAKHYRPITNYITYDFETVEEPMNTEKKSTQVIAKIHPHTVALTIDTRKYDKDEGKVTSICFREGNSGKDFVHKFIATLFEYAKIIAKNNMYKQIPGVSEEVMRKINYYAKSDEVMILGFNSAKFDMNLFLDNLECDDWSIDEDGKGE